ncbi:MAG: hemolysin III family protein [Syntrophaceae bacterium]|nr:hemolysin III family protein [Syntrophaceae bacterium]
MACRLREPISGLTHFCGAVGAALGLALLLILGHDSVTKAISLTIYGLSLILMFSASSAYHLATASPKVISVLRKIDHSAIYVLIAGSYTPICINFFNGFWQWGLLAIVWSMAIVGVITKIFFINAPRWISAGIYLIMGWLSVVALPEMMTHMPRNALLGLLFGGIFFTLGAIVYVLKKPDIKPGFFGFHEIWHIFVILGCACHFAVIAIYVAPSIMPA